MGLVAGHHSVHSHATGGGEVLSSESELSHDEEDVTDEDENVEADKGGVETSSDGQVALDGKDGQECPQTQDTPTGIARSLVNMRTQTQSLTPGRKSSQSGEGGTLKVPRRTAPLRCPANHLWRKSNQQTRHSMTRPGKELSSWTHILMLGITKRLLRVSRAGPPETP